MLKFLFLLTERNRSKGVFHLVLSAFVAFCVSMTVGVLWEFFEFSMDSFIKTDMQKDRIITEISRAALNPDGLNEAVKIKGITDTVLMSGDEPLYVIEGGYLDFGIIDTMKDLFVNFIGAVVFSVVGYFCIIGRSRGVFAAKFIPQYMSDGGERGKNEAESNKE